jgi:hypothetical protein
MVRSLARSLARPLSSFAPRKAPPCAHARRVARTGYAFTFSSKIQASAETGSRLAGRITNFIDHVQARSPHLSWFSVETGLRILLYLFSFGISIGFAVGKPACFLVMLEYFGTLLLFTTTTTIIVLFSGVCSLTCAQRASRSTWRRVCSSL